MDEARQSKQTTHDDIQAAGARATNTSKRQRVIYPRGLLEMKTRRESPAEISLMPRESDFVRLAAQQIGRRLSQGKHASQGRRRKRSDLLPIDEAFGCDTNPAIGSRR